MAEEKQKQGKEENNGNSQEDKIEREIEQEEEKELKKDIVDESGRRVVGAEITEEMAD